MYFIINTMLYIKYRITYYVLLLCFTLTFSACKIFFTHRPSQSCSIYSRSDYFVRHSTAEPLLSASEVHLHNTHSFPAGCPPSSQGSVWQQASHVHSRGRLTHLQQSTLTRKTDWKISMQPLQLSIV